MFCIAVLVAAAVAMSAINEVEDHYNDHGSTAYEHADSYRRAARWFLLVSIIGIIFHSNDIVTLPLSQLLHEIFIQCICIFDEWCIYE